MEKIRRGNDIEIKWAIYAGSGINEVPFDLTGKHISLYFKNARGKIAVKSYSINKHIISFVFFGKDQLHSGVYSLELVVNEGMEGMHTVDECNAFRLVDHSCQTSSTEGCVAVQLQFRANIGIIFPENGGGGSTPSIEVDNVLSETSENPVQNKVVTKAINDLNGVMNTLAESVSGLDDKVVGYEEEISDAVSKSENAVNAVNEITRQIETISEEVESLSDKVDSLENGEITWTDVQ